jgi:hypothetical protein
MQDRFNITIPFETHHGDEQTGELEVTIGFRYYKGRAQSYYEPGEEPHCEWTYASFDYTPVTGDQRETKAVREIIEGWAETWVDENQAECLRIVHDQHEDDRERAAEYRRER